MAVRSTKKVETKEKTKVARKGEVVVKAKKATKAKEPKLCPVMKVLFERYVTKLQAKKLTVKDLTKKAKGCGNIMESAEAFNSATMSEIIAVARALGYTEIRVKL